MELRNDREEIWTERDWTRAPGTSARLSSEIAVHALRSGLQACLRGQAGDTELRRALGTMCVQARADGARVEELILLLKEAWRRLPEVERTADGRRRDDVLEKAVTHCIEQFYQRRP